jgi:hypothetical protein
MRSPRRTTSTTESAPQGAGEFGVVLRFLYGAVISPVRRLVGGMRDEVDYRYRLARAESELKRRIAAIEEEHRVRALTASARVHENAARAVTDADLQLELEELRGRSERVVLRSQSTHAARMLARYQAAFFSLKEARHLTRAEKARLLEEMRGILAEGTTRTPHSNPEGEDSELSLEGQSPVVLEYRAPGGRAIPVTADGFRRLLERGQLKDDDECRRVGSMAWVPVAEMLDPSLTDPEH